MRALLGQCGHGRRSGDDDGHGACDDADLQPHHRHAVQARLPHLSIPLLPSLLPLHALRPPQHQQRPLQRPQLTVQQGIADAQLRPPLVQVDGAKLEAAVQVDAVGLGLVERGRWWRGREAGWRSGGG